MFQLLLGLSLYAWATLPLTSSQVILCAWLPLPRYVLFDFLVAYVGGVSFYMYIFGVVKAFSHKYRQRPWRLVMYTVGALLTIPFNIWIENLAVLWGMIGQKHQ
uniref:Uncharacterized protein n=1 Tax=Plectus sambesii TaxID=2011161 RepID=A0A914V0T0_9BILA